jgi:uncharacterized protein
MNLVDAIYRKNHFELKKLLDAGVDINQVDKDGRTPLMHAVLSENADAKMIAFLVEKGADLDSADKAQQWTALHFAARDQKAEIVEILVQGGARIDPADIFGNTPLWRCVMNATPDIRIVEYLIRMGADPSKKNKSEVSALDLARMMGKKELTDLLLSRSKEVKDNE